MMGAALVELLRSYLAWHNTRNRPTADPAPRGNP